jgi:beta-mannosidase
MESRIVLPINQDWTFKQVDNDKSNYLPVAQFPTNVHLDLIANGLIPDPFFGKNELEVQWVGEAVWSYRTTFKAPSMPAHTKAVLAFDGLDTFATVKLNGTEILKTDNMFIPERVNVTSMVKANVENELEITFDSAFLRGKEIVEQYPNHHWGCWNGDPSRLAVRKAQYHYVSGLLMALSLSQI